MFERLRSGIIKIDLGAVSIKNTPFHFSLSMCFLSKTMSSLVDRGKHKMYQPILLNVPDRT